MHGALRKLCILTIWSVAFANIATVMAKEDSKLVYVSYVRFVGKPTNNASNVPGPGVKAPSAGGGEIAAGATIGAQAGGTTGSALAGGIAMVAVQMISDSGAEPGDLMLMMTPYAFLFLECSGKNIPVKGRNVHAFVRPYHWYKSIENDAGEVEIWEVPQEQRTGLKENKCFSEFQRLWGINVGTKIPNSDPEDIF